MGKTSKRHKKAHHTFHIFTCKKKTKSIVSLFFHIAIMHHFELLYRMNSIGLVVAKWCKIYIHEYW